MIEHDVRNISKCSALRVPGIDRNREDARLCSEHPGKYQPEQQCCWIKMQLENIDKRKPEMIAKLIQAMLFTWI